MNIAMLIKSYYKKKFRWSANDLSSFISADRVRGTNRYAYAKGNPVKYVDPMGLKEVAYGDTEIIEWNTGNYHRDRPHMSYDTQFSQKIREGLYIFYERKHYRYGFLNKLTDHNTIVCCSWSDEFIDYKCKENSINIRLLEKLTGARKITPFRVNSNPYVSGHSYVYLRFRFHDNSEEWWVTETNIPYVIPDTYGSFRIDKPDRVLKRYAY